MRLASSSGLQIGDTMRYVIDGPKAIVQTGIITICDKYSVTVRNKYGELRKLNLRNINAAEVISLIELCYKEVETDLNL